jgi:voltage-gated potassium channel
LPRIGNGIRRLTEIIGVGALAMTAYFLVPMDGAAADVVIVLLVVGSVVLLVPLAVRRSQEVLVADQPLLVAAQALFTLVTLLVVSFSSVYFVLGTQSDPQIDGIATKIDALYFTVTILSTVGFGDITATGQFGRVVVTVNMVVNLVLVTVALRLLSWALQQRHVAAQRLDSGQGARTGAAVPIKSRKLSQ